MLLRYKGKSKGDRSEEFDVLKTLPVPPQGGGSVAALVCDRFTATGGGTFTHRLSGRLLFLSAQRGV